MGLGWVENVSTLSHFNTQKNHISKKKKNTPTNLYLINNKECQTKLEHSLSLSPFRRRSHGFSLRSDLALIFARCIGSQHKAKEDLPFTMPYTSSSSPFLYLPVKSFHFSFISFLFVSRESSNKLNQHIDPSFVFSAPFQPS